MGKKAKVYKSGDFIFAKVKGYPAWPARVQKLNGKKYYVYFYGTGETANLPPSQIFDYAENQKKFLSKTVKRKDFNDGVKQIEHDFANNVPLSQTIGLSADDTAESGTDTLNDTANETTNESLAGTTATDDTISDENSSLHKAAVEDSDDALIIDEGKEKGKKSKFDFIKKETSATKMADKEVKTPKNSRGRPKKEDKEDEPEEKRDEEELVSRSGRKIRPKRYVDEHTEENATLPYPAAKRFRCGSPAAEKSEMFKLGTKANKQFNTFTQAELEDIKKPLSSDDPDKKNVLLAYVAPHYVGIKLFQSRPKSFKNEASRLQWDRLSAANSIKLKQQLEKGHITIESVSAQIVMDLHLSEEEKATLDKEREIEEKRSRVQFLKTEMKLIELDAKIKSCLSLEKANTETCLKLLDELFELEVKPLMLLKHPTCLETIKRMRAYVGNTPSWDLNEADALHFNKQAHSIRRQADTLYKNLKALFSPMEGLSFWEFFSERVLHFKKVTAKLDADELLELVHEPLEMTQPTSHTMKTSIEIVNQRQSLEADDTDNFKKTFVKSMKTESTPRRILKRKSIRSKVQDEKETNKNDEEITIKEEKESNETDEEETNKKDDNESNEKDEKESYKKESIKKEDKESNKKDDKESHKKDEKESTRKVSSRDTRRAEEKDKMSKEKESNKKSDEKSNRKSSSKDSSKKSDAKVSKKKEEKEYTKEESDVETEDLSENENSDGSEDLNKIEISKEEDLDTHSDTEDSKMIETSESEKEKTDEEMEVSDIEEKDKDNRVKSLDETEKSSKNSGDFKGDRPKSSEEKDSSGKKTKDTGDSKESSGKKTKDSGEEKEYSSKKTKDTGDEKEGSKRIKDSEEKEGGRKRTKGNGEEKEVIKRPRDNGEEKDNEKSDDEPRAKRSRDSKKSEAVVPRSPIKRKSKS